MSTPIVEGELEWNETKVIQQLSNTEEERKLRLYGILKKYKNHMTSKPGKCNLFTYKFQVEMDKPIVGYSRPIPFAIRAEVQQQIEQMVKDDIIEISNSPILNLLTVVPHEGKKPRISVDARRVNQCTIPDRERVPPMQEILQRFGGVQYISSLDLSSAYLQIELAEESRKFTVFLFGTTVYQYKRVPYGFKNSSSAFIRALKLTLGNRRVRSVLCR
jgi:hypothetical protein